MFELIRYVQAFSTSVVIQVLGNAIEQNWKYLQTSFQFEL